MKAGRSSLTWSFIIPCSQNDSRTVAVRRGGVCGMLSLVTLALREIIQMATIKVMQNGPYLVQGDDVTAVDWNGATYAIPKRPFALCRCGGSTTKPFCDGTHSRSGFKAAEAAVPGSQDKPATKP
jgi:CDGSH-type Zn-finger protein